MSLSALSYAVYNTLINGNIPVSFTNPSQQILVQEDGRPSPGAGDLFVSIHPTRWSVGPIDDGVTTIDEVYDLSVTLSIRTTIAPEELMASALYLKGYTPQGGGGYLHIATGMEDYCRQIILAIDKQYAITTLANSYLGSTTFGLIEYLRWSDTDPAPITRTGEWWWSDRKEDLSRACGWSMENRFTGARRVQYSGAAIGIAGVVTD